MKILVTGANGQVGWELARSLLPLGEVMALDRREFDLSAPDSLPATLDALAPDVIVNAAAYTAVDLAEDEEALATRINGEAVAVMARWAAAHRALLVHYSTDYVFDGSKATPYVESDTPCPINAYGRSKLAGEQALAASGADYLCLRVSWVYADRGKNFLRTMLRLGAAREELAVISDQHGVPTGARQIADATLALVAVAMIRRREGGFRGGLYHMTPSGQTSWHGFAEKIFELASGAGRELAVRRVRAIPSSDYPVKARRPLNSLMDSRRLAEDYGVSLPVWSCGVELLIRSAAASGLLANGLAG